MKKTMIWLGILAFMIITVQGSYAIRAQKEISLAETEFKAIIGSSKPAIEKRFISFGKIAKNLKITGEHQKALDYMNVLKTNLENRFQGQTSANSSDFVSAFYLLAQNNYQPQVMMDDKQAVIVLPTKSCSLALDGKPELNLNTPLPIVIQKWQASQKTGLLPTDQPSTQLKPVGILARIGSIEKYLPTYQTVMKSIKDYYKKIRSKLTLNNLQDFWQKIIIVSPDGDRDYFVYHNDVFYAYNQIALKISAQKPQLTSFAIPLKQNKDEEEKRRKQITVVKLPAPTPRPGSGDGPDPDFDFDFNDINGVLDGIDTISNRNECWEYFSNIKNFAPVAIAGEDQTVRPGMKIILNGSKSYDPDQSPNPQLSYSWKQMPFTSVILNNANSANAGFTVPLNAKAGRLIFELTVSDGALQDRDQVVITVNP